MNHYLKKLVLLLLIFQIFGCKTEIKTGGFNSSENEEVQLNSIVNVTPKDFQAQKLENKDLVIIDVRTRDELTETGFIESAFNIDYNSPSFIEEIKKLNVDKTYLIYCKSGARSRRAILEMKKIGINKVSNLEGGISSWISENFPIVKK